ncbi:MAG: glycoside hydrolase family 3 protein [Pseudomonadota bacterium]|uniref:glycoside hydrolase family 3 protein n=1 Tax=Sphingobium TaxID=165695 RepID=UPI0002DF06C0|nr:MULTISPECIES: glycoside hydrolase family 3 N-terminal domain-containing protein [Sphingobium]OUC56469.1 glycoside hydrolase [Sphingobium sp. GW456-12-10-14-TSB1]QWT15268.1 glycoside hydrolase family 3 protein [Sphingobium xenophagum]|tara:strand:+ start:3763 stop:5457 length:1695 start_codon:yes stop_codon:yes gene_type:complete
MLLDSLTPPPTEPLSIDEEARAWVERTRDAMSIEEMIGQLFIFSTSQDSAEELGPLLALKPGGINRFPRNDLSAFRSASVHAIEQAVVPPVFTGDIEGGTISYPFATTVPNIMGIAACDDLATTEAIARLVARESRVLGYDWSFGPVVDINHAFRSAIVGTRSFGSRPENVLAQASVYIRALQEEGVAACLKHWPGDGFDDRDQHLVTSVNPLSVEEWHGLFGRIYGQLIGQGVMTVMSAHIAFPAYIRAHLPDAGREAFQPATVSHLLNQRLLREELGFKGLIVSDATGMGGLTGWMERSETVPAVIENGCDMFLFSRAPQRDYGFMLDGLRNGRLSEGRLYEAVTRILTLKARLGLHRIDPAERMMPIEAMRDALQTPDHRVAALQAAGQSITLVKDTQSLLPLAPATHRRVVIVAEEGFSFWDGALSRGYGPVLDELRARGFEPRMLDVDQWPTREDTDLVLYLVGQEATPSAAHIFLDLVKLHGSNRKAMSQFAQEIPTALLSFGQPYYLYDAPHMKTCVNAYSAIEPVLRETVRRLTGEAPFTGVSPVDPFCGQEQLRW